VLAFDSDEAGSKAALRSHDLESPFRLDLDLRVASMPDGLDPADLYQDGRGDELAKAVRTARPLLEHRIEKEVARHDLTGPEGRARALHAAVEHVRRVNDPIARGEYNRYVARLIGVDMSTVENAVRGTNRRRTESEPAPEAPLDRAESELFRVVLSNPPDMDVTASDFQDPRLRRAFDSVSGQLASAAPGAPVDPALVEDPTLQTLIRGLVMDGRPLPDWTEMKTRVRLRRIEAEIDDVEAEVAGMDENSESYSESLRRLIALQQEKRSLGQ
jgi:DNA primase